MLIKDAVFVAELSTSPEKYARDREKYGVSPAAGDRIVYHHLWNPTVRLAGRDVRFNLTLRDSTLKMIRGARFLRKLPGWHRQEREYLARYEAALAEFLAAPPPSDDQYRAWLTRLGSAWCMNCMNPRCREAGCPLSSFIPQWVQLAYQERWQEAAERLHETNNFPEFTSRICPAPCHDACKQALGGYPVQVRHLARPRARAAGRSPSSVRVPRASRRPNSSRARDTKSSSSRRTTRPAGCCGTASPISGLRRSSSTAAWNSFAPREWSSARACASGRRSRAWN
jgi:hypothetical protein